MRWTLTADGKLALRSAPQFVLGYNAAKRDAWRRQPGNAEVVDRGAIQMRRHNAKI